RDNVIGEYSTGIHIASSNQLHITGNKVGVWDNASNSSFPCGTGIYLISTQGELLQNAISQNSLSQLQVTYGQNLLVESNTIGSTYFLAAGSGISTNQSIGFTLRYNTIQNNKGYGIDLALSTQFTLDSNFILRNTAGGIRFSQTTDSSVVNNTIHSNGENDQAEPYNEDGILLENSSGNGFTGNRIGLYLGANEGHGIHLIDSSNNTIGGYVPTDGNIIGNNYKSGIFIEGTGSRDNEIGGNFIGYDNSVAPVYQIQPNGNHGISLYYLTESNTIGAVGIFAAPNVIASNSWSGIAIVQSNHNHISDNYIGTDTNGKALGNGGHGVNIVDGNNNTINSNTVAYNGKSNSRQGVAVDGLVSYGNSVSQNSIYQNGGAPIVLLNGANSSILPPTLSRTDNTLSGTTCANCTVEFFSGSNGSDIRFYEAAVQANGAGGYSYQLSKHVRGKFIRATATDLTAGTSQISDAVFGYNFPWTLFNVNFRKR
ncbi:MAG: right-handed parallel beta-helix repeat-containing protein, partial [Desulfopila sp.]|nr:right-handed parallel beta-helix repeat-containing protein [Desulfopila sp.]